MSRVGAAMAALVALVACSTPPEGALDEDCVLDVEVEPLVLPVAELTEANQAALGDVGLRAIVTDHDGEPAPRVRVSFAVGDDPNGNNAVALTDEAGIAFKPASELGPGPLLNVNTEGSYRAVLTWVFCSTVTSEPAPITFAPVP
jgi:hypothetical protein